MLIHPTFFETWIHDVDRMNQGKEGRPYTAPDSFIQYLAFVRTRLNGLDNRSLEGFAEALIENLAPGLQAGGMPKADVARIKTPSFSQIRRRIKNLDLDPRDVSLLKEGDHVDIILDATGVKVTNRGEWIRRRGSHAKKGWLKLHLGIDAQNQQTAAVFTTTERVGDVRQGPRLTKQAAGHVRRAGATPGRLLADGAYDSRAAFDACRAHALRPVIKPRTKSSRRRKAASGERPKRVAEYQDLG